MSFFITFLDILATNGKLTKTTTKKYFYNRKTATNKNIPQKSSKQHKTKNKTKTENIKRK